MEPQRSNSPACVRAGSWPRLLATSRGAWSCDQALGGRLTLSRPLLIASLAATLLCAASHQGLASIRFDFIYTDTLDASLCPNGCGLTLIWGDDFALLANTGEQAVTDSDFASVHFTATSSFPGIRLAPDLNFINGSPNPHPLGPVPPKYALGGIVPSENAILSSRLEPDETLINTAPRQVWFFTLQRVGWNTYEGVVTIHITMDMSGQRVEFDIVVNVSLGTSADCTFRGAGRVRSSSIVPVQPTSWGKLKTLYR